MKLTVDAASRFAKMRAHTATHLMHAQIAKIFPQTKQAGSFVDDDYLRFDFYTERTLTPEELKTIEKDVNQIIYDALPVQTKETSLDDATKLWAKAFFEDKYGDKVRLVQVCHLEWNEGYESNETVSSELCGGTHVNNTKDIGCFCIIAQEAVASGIKRLIAITGPKVMEEMTKIKDLLMDTTEKLGIKTPIQIPQKLEKTLKEYDDMKDKIETLETKIIKEKLEGKDYTTDTTFQKIFLFSSDIDFKAIAFHARSLCTDDDTLVYAPDGNFYILSQKNGKAKSIAESLWVKGGGSEKMVQGRDVKILETYK